MPSRTASVSSFFCRSISFICKELIRYCFGANILPYWNRELDYFRRSQDGTHSSRDECIHLRTNAFISGPMLSSRDQCSHLRINALISGSMLSSRDQCSHLRINALISGSMLSSPALGGGQLKPELAQTMLQRPKEMARFLLILKRADKIIRVPNQASFARCVPFDDFMKPQI